MNIGRKIILSIAGGSIGLVIVVLLVKFIIDSPYKKQIPELPDLHTLALPVQEQLTFASKIAHRNPTADNLGMLGMVYHSSAQYEKATRCYELAVKKNKHKWLWSYYLGYLNRELGESTAAIENFKHVTRENPKMYLAWYYTGEGLQTLGKSDQAEAIYSMVANAYDLKEVSENKTIGDYFPLSTYARFQLARIYLNTQRFDQAEKTLSTIIKANRTFGPAYRLLGNLYRLKGDSIMSKEFILRANDLTDYTSPLDKLVDGIALQSRSDQYIMKQIDEAERKAHPEFALALADRAFNYMPHNKYLISKMVKLLLDMNKGKQALPYLDEHIKYFKDDFNEIKEVANLLYEKEFYEQARMYYTQAAAMKHEDNEVQSSLVLCLWKEGMKDQALEKMNNLVVNDKENLKILANGVYIMLVIGEKEKALSYLAKLRKLAPSNPKVELMTGMVAEMDGKIQEAIDMYELSFKGNPKDMATIQALGKILTKQKMWSRAIDHYRKVLEYFPNEPYLLEEYGTLLISCPDQKLRNIDEGLKFSERAFIHKASTPDVAMASGKSIAMAYAARGDYRTASAYMDWVVSMAQKQKAPAEYLEELENLLKQYSAH